MKVWSKTLTRMDLEDAAARVNREFPGCALYLGEGLSLHEGPRVRRFDGVTLRSHFGIHKPNPGTGGGGWNGELAASWTEHGWWMARVFERDPDAIVRGVIKYDGAQHFHEATSSRFVDPRNPRERQVKRHLSVVA